MLFFSLFWTLHFAQTGSAASHCGHRPKGFCLIWLVLWSYLSLEGWSISISVPFWSTPEGPGVELLYLVAFLSSDAQKEGHGHVAFQMFGVWK